jgi:hypothetical protein
MHNLACVFAQAAARAEADAAEADRAALAARYRESALEAVRRTLALVRPEARAAFRRDVILPDGALDPIRRCPEFERLMRE